MIAKKIILIAILWTGLINYGYSDIKKMVEKLAQDNNITTNDIIVLCENKQTIPEHYRLIIALPAKLKNCNLSAFSMLSEERNLLGRVKIVVPNGSFPHIDAEIISSFYLQLKTPGIFKYGTLVIEQNGEGGLDLSGLQGIKASNLKITVNHLSSLVSLKKNEYVKSIATGFTKKGDFDFKVLNMFPNLLTGYIYNADKFINFPKYSFRKVSLKFYNCYDYKFLSSIRTDRSITLNSMSLDMIKIGKLLAENPNSLTLILKNCLVVNFQTVEKIKFKYFFAVNCYFKNNVYYYGNFSRGKPFDLKLLNNDGVKNIYIYNADIFTSKQASGRIKSNNLTFTDCQFTNFNKFRKIIFVNDKLTLKNCTVDGGVNISSVYLNPAKEKNKQKQRPSLGSNIWASIASTPSNIVGIVDYNLGSITSVLSTILFWSAMVLFGVIIFLKWKAKNNR
jgi:hypothetical protein